VPAGYSDLCVGLYLLLSMDSYLRSGSTNIVNINGESASPCRLSLCIGIVAVFSRGGHIVCARYLIIELFACGCISLNHSEKPKSLMVWNTFL
jgi:hypothetical protein